MRQFTLVVFILFICQYIFAQTPIQNIKQGYFITIGIRPDARKVKELRENKKLNASSLKEVVGYLNNYISDNRTTIQRGIIERAYYAVFKMYPDSRDVEDLYSSTEKKCKNFYDFINEFRTYFKDGVTEPE